MSEVGVIPYHGDGSEKQREEAVAWLREQITARLERAKAAVGGNWPDVPWDVTECTNPENPQLGCKCIVYQGEYKPFDEPQVPPVRYVCDAETPELSAHIAANDPQQVIADCEAQLAILDRCAIPVMTGVARDVVRYVASAYRHREGYVQHWGNGADVH